MSFLSKLVRTVLVIPNIVDPEKPDKSKFPTAQQLGLKPTNSQAEADAQARQYASSLAYGYSTGLNSTVNSLALSNQGGNMNEGLGFGSNLVLNEGVLSAMNSSQSGGGINWTNVITTGVSTLPGLISSIFNKGGGSTTTTTTGTTGASVQGSVQAAIDALGVKLNLGTATAKIPTWIWIAGAAIIGVVIYLLTRGGRRK